MILLREIIKKIGYHVTKGSSLPNILKHGLIPHSPTMGDQLDDEGVYFFPDKITLDDAWMAWLEDFFDEDERVYCLEVDITGLEQHIGGDYEIVVTQVVPPNRILKQTEIT